MLLGHKITNKQKPHTHTRTLTYTLDVHSGCSTSAVPGAAPGGVFVLDTMHFYRRADEGSASESAARHGSLAARRMVQRPA